MNYRLIAYAQDFVSFLLDKLNKDSMKINQIILFGSLARGEAEKGSDVDLFIDTTDEKIEEMIKQIKEKFYESVKFKKYWKLLGIRNEINCITGKLKEWEDLRRSIIANGIVLFGKYKSDVNTKPYYLFIVFPGKNRNKNMSVWRGLYGYSQKVGKKNYAKKGLVEEYDGEKLARSVFIIPAEHTQKIQFYLKHHKFKHKILPFWKEE